MIRCVIALSLSLSVSTLAATSLATEVTWDDLTVGDYIAITAVERGTQDDLDYALAYTIGAYNGYLRYAVLSNDREMRYCLTAERLHGDVRQLLTRTKEQIAEREANGVLPATDPLSRGLHGLWTKHFLCDDGEEGVRFPFDKGWSEMADRSADKIIETDLNREFFVSALDSATSKEVAITNGYIDGLFGSFWQWLPEILERYPDFACDADLSHSVDLFEVRSRAVRNIRERLEGLGTSLTPPNELVGDSVERSFRNDSIDKHSACRL